MSPKGYNGKPLAIYTRVSRQGRRSDAEMLSPELQEAKIRKWAARDERIKLALNPTTGKPFTDIDRSGGKMARKELDAVIEGIKEGRYGGIAVSRLSRYARSTLGGLRVAREIENAGGVLAAVDAPYDTTTAMGKKQLRDALSLAEYDIDLAREYTEETMEQKIVVDGIHQAAAPPAGYSYSVTGVDENGKEIRGPLAPNEHAPAIVAAFRLRAEGGTWTQVARLLTKAGVPTSRGSTTWGLKAAEKLTRNVAYLGVARSGGVRKIDPETGQVTRSKVFEKPDAHEAIVEQWLFAAVEKRRDTRARTRGPSEGRLLSGLLHCGACNALLTLDWLRRDGERYYFYRCRGRDCRPPRPAIAALKVEAWMDGALRAAWAEAAKNATVEIVQTDDETQSLRAELESAVAADEYITASVENGTLSAEDAVDLVVAAKARLRKAREALLKFEIAEHAEPLAPFDALDPRIYDEMPLPVKRQLMERMLRWTGNRIVVSPGRAAGRVRLEEVA